MIKGIFTLPPSSVANVVLEIIKSKKPKPRYYVTKATYILGFKKVLSQNGLINYSKSIRKIILV